MPKTLIYPEWIDGGAGGSSFPALIVNNAATFSAVADTLHIVDATSGAITVNLPAPVSGLKFELKILGNDTVTVSRNAAEDIEGVAADYTINNNLGAYMFISDGTDWFII